MNKIEIEVPINVRYISDWKDFDNSLLQGHSIINKTITGCGFTTYALENNIPTILCSPRKFLLTNKHKQLPHTYLVINSGEKGVYIDSEEQVKVLDPIKELYQKPKEKSKDNYLEICTLQDDLRTYIVNCQASGHPPKILVTYDSLKIVLSVLEEMVQFYSIVVDEFQNIFMDAPFKADTELNFVNVLQSCPNVTYLSATPYIEEYLNELDEFKNLPYYELKWHVDRLQTIKIDAKKTVSLSKEVDKIIQDYLSGNYPEKVDDKGVVHQSKEVVFYTNSVKLIVSTIKRNKLTPDQVNIICADTEKNRDSLKPLKMIIGTSPLEGEPHKMFTFCTRTTYVGADFYSPCALSVIVSDCKIDSLATDIRMDFPQIMGRQRLKENVFRDECIFIYKLADKEVTIEEFEKRAKEKLQLTQEDISNFKSVSLSRGSTGTSRMLSDFQWRIKTKKYKEDYTGINEKTGEPVINKLVYIAEKRSFEIRSDVYKSEVQVYNEFARIIEECPIKFLTERQEAIHQAADFCRSTKSFELIMKVVCDLLLDPQWFGHIHTSDLYWLPLNYRNYLNYLGPERIRACSYYEASVKRELNSKFGVGTIKERLIGCFILGEKYSLRSIKECLKTIYSELGLSKTPKATDLLEYFEVKEVLVTDPITKKRIGGYEILSIK